MKDLIRSILRSISTLRRISSLALEQDLKDKIRDTYLNTILLKRYDAKNNIADIAGFKVQFCTFGSLAYLFDEIFLGQEYSFAAGNQSPFIIDCGSNIGMSILFFKMMYPNSAILAFEPDKEAFLCLETNVRANELQSVEVHNKAVSKEEGRIDFYYDPDNPGSFSMSTVQERMPKQRRTVEAVRLSRYIDREVDFLKMDVEGAEGGIVEELSNEGRLIYIRQMVIEYHHHIVKDTDSFSQMLRVLENARFGYQIQSDFGRPFKCQQFQDILLYAYRKDCGAPVDE